MLVDTPIVELLVELALGHSTVSYQKNEFDKSGEKHSATARHGNLAFLTQIGYRLQQMALENDKIASILRQNKKWEDFQTIFLENSV